MLSLLPFALWLLLLMAVTLRSAWLSRWKAERPQNVDSLWFCNSHLQQIPIFFGQLQFLMNRDRKLMEYKDVAAGKTWRLASHERRESAGKSPASRRFQPRRYSNPWMSVREIKSCARTARKASMALQIKTISAIIIPIQTVNGEDYVWLVEQFRYTVLERCLELPQGGWEMGEVDAEAAGAWGIEEELGLHAETMNPFGDAFGSGMGL